MFLKTFASDVTDYLQLLLRKSGHHLHTSAEREVVRTIKEKCCYVAANPQKEEKETQGRTEEFHLPDGNAIQVCRFLPSRPPTLLSHRRLLHYSIPSPFLPSTFTTPIDSLAHELAPVKSCFDH